MFAPAPPIDNTWHSGFEASVVAHPRTAYYAASEPVAIEKRIQDLTGYVRYHVDSIARQAGISREQLYGLLLVDAGVSVLPSHMPRVGTIEQPGYIPATTHQGEGTLMQSAPALAELREALRGIARGVVARPQGTGFNIIAFIEPRDLAAVKTANKTWRDFSRSHRELDTSLDTQFYTDGAIDAYLAEGFVEVE